MIFATSFWLDELFFLVFFCDLKSVYFILHFYIFLLFFCWCLYVFSYVLFVLYGFECCIGCLLLYFVKIKENQKSKSPSLSPSPSPSPGSAGSSDMIDQWIALVHQKNILVSEESDLMVA